MAHEQEKMDALAVEMEKAAKTLRDAKFDLVKWREASEQLESARFKNKLTYSDMVFLRECGISLQ